MRRTTPLSLPLLALAAVVLLYGTRRDLSEPHWRLFSDMVRSPAYGSQEPNPVFADGRTLQAPPAGTAHLGSELFLYGPGEKERKRAGREVENPVRPGFDALARGKRVFETQCAHCHGLEGAGDGPVAKAFPAFSFPVNGQSTLDLPVGELFHLLGYGRNLMPPARIQLSSRDRWRVVHYVRELGWRELERLGPEGIVPKDPRRDSLVSKDYGAEIFAANCAACHGEKGLRPQPGIPTLNAPAVLAVAPDAYYWSIIAHGRPGTQMPAWQDILTPTQLESLVAYIHSWAAVPPNAAAVAAAQGDAGRGRLLYARQCAGCHGAAGQGGIGNSLNAPSFLAVASDAFLRDTISGGRRHTAMPAAYGLDARAVADLVADLRSRQRDAPAFPEVAALLPGASADAGKEAYALRCAACHGEEGEGLLGSRLNEDAFLSSLDDRALYRILVEGRPGTAMPSWRHLPARELAGLLVLMRSWQTSPVAAGSTWTARGRAEFGEVLFEKNCVKCHGEEGRGDLGSQIGNPVFLAQVTDGFLRRVISYGKRGTEMKGFLARPRDPLSPKEIEHLVVYLRSLAEKPRLEPLRKTFSWASPEDGREVYEKTGQCAKCHGRGGEGGSGPALGNPVFLRAATNGFLAATIVMGREKSEMKSYSVGEKPLLGPEEIENAVAYIRTFEQMPMTASRRVKIAPERVSRGRRLYRRECAACHGRAGEGKREKRPGSFGPSLNNAEFLRAADDDFLLATIAMGRPGTPMPPFTLEFKGRAPLSAEDIRALVAFLRSWEKGS